MSFYHIIKVKFYCQLVYIPAHKTIYMHVECLTLVCVGLRRIVTVAFLRHVQIFLLTYLLMLTLDLPKYQ